MELIITVVVGLAGMLAHFWKRKIKKQSISGLIDYMKGHLTYTLAAVSATLVGVWIMAPPVLPPFGSEWVTVFSPVFMYGYMCDSAINKELEKP